MNNRIGRLTYSVVQNKLDTSLKVIFLKQRMIYSDSINIYLNRNVLVAIGEKSDEIIIQIKQWHLF